MLKAFTHSRFATHIAHLPFVQDTLMAYNHLDPVIDPSSAKKEGEFIPLPERETFWQHLRGTMGKGIPWETKDRKAPEL